MRPRCGTGAMYVAGQAVLTSGTTCTAIPIYHLGCTLVCVGGESVEKAWGSYSTLPLLLPWDAIRTQ